MKLVIKAVFVIAVALFALLLLERVVLNPRPATPVGLAVLGFLAVAGVAAGLSLAALRTRLAGVVVNAWLVVLSTSVAYVAADVLGGILLIRSDASAIISDPVLHHRLRPGSATRVSTPEFAHTEHVNDLGLRGTPVAREKPAGSYRILMLGDSFTMGEGVSDGETFSALLGESLNRREPGVRGPRIEVLNAGVDSYTPLLSLLQLRNWSGALEPDHVVLNLDMSDLVQEQAYRHLAIRDADGTVVAVSPAPKGDPHNWAGRLLRLIDNHLLLTRFVLLKAGEWTRDSEHPTVRGAVAAPDHELLLHTIVQDSTDRDAQWRDLFESVLDIRRYCEERGMAFTLTTYPWAHQVGNRDGHQWRAGLLPRGAVASDASLARIRAFAAAQGMRLVDMFPDFRAYAGPEPLYFDANVHWTPAGHRVAWARLDAELRTLIPWRGEPPAP